jgi:short-subunit dehydrogenase
VKHVLTGAGSGIGLALAQRLAARGDELVLVARSEARAAEMADAFEGAQVLVADLADPGTLNGLGRQVDGPVDSLVHLAGVIELGRVDRLRLTDLEEQLAVNLIAPAVLTRELLPHLRQARGTVVFVNSSAGLVANAEWSAYAASKHGLKAFADALREEETEHGVRVSSVYPGRTATTMQAKVHEQEGKEYDASRWASAETVAGTVLHVIDLPADAAIPDVRIRPAPGR